MDYKMNDIITLNKATEQLGLFSGRAGLALICNLLADENVAYKQMATKHIHYLAEHVYEAPSMTFSEGLLGIGWTFEFLTQNQYIDTSYDRLLMEIDDIIYKWVTFHGTSSFSLDNGYIGCFMYLYYRLKGNRIRDRYKELALKECTILTMGRIYQETKKQEQALLSDKEWIQIHILASKFKNLNLQNHIAIDLLFQTQKRVKECKWQTPKAKVKNTIPYLLHMAFKNSRKFRNTFDAFIDTE